MSGKILIIEDEESIRDACRQILSRIGYQVDGTGKALEGLKMALTDNYNLILLDVRMPKMNGIDILKKLKKENYVSAKVIVITGYATIPMAVEVMRHGAANFLTKPFSADQLKDAVGNALKGYESRDLDKDIITLIGVSDYMKELKDSIKRVAQTDSTVLITGLSGTGKELVARTIHQLSQRADKLFVPVDCSSLAENLMESELFGHVKGAFSGATESRDGRFQMADKGALFLD